MRQELFQQTFQITQAAHQSHLVYRVYVPEEVSDLEVHFQYGPIVERDQQMIRKAVRREGLNESVVQYDTTIRNLLTVSINDPNQYRGAHHFFAEKQKIIISETEATEGFITGKIVEGYWEFIISCHGVFSEKVDGRLAVYAKTKAIVEQMKVRTPLDNLALEQMIKNRQPETLQVKRIELHSHTVHSDADQTTEELLKQATLETIDWLAITDHNTISALTEAEKQQNSDQSVQVLPGIEYTTFFGHFLLHGPKEKIVFDWTKLAKRDLSFFLKQCQADDVYITVAHPFDEGNPFCTGCRFDYVLNNLKYIDAIEVWNGTNPHKSLANEDAFYKWTELLKKGYEIAAVSGRDWHRLYSDEEIAYTFILVPEEETALDIIRSLKLGRTYVSLRPKIDFKVNQIYSLGDKVIDQTGVLHISLQLDELNEGDRIRIYAQHDLVIEKVIASDKNWESQFPLLNDEYSLLRVEVLNNHLERIAFTNPIYISQKFKKG